MTNRLGVYVDGFNLYHGLCELNENHLKWLNLRALSQRIALPYKVDVKLVKYFTATNSKHANSEQKSRHRKYIEALAKTSVQTIKGKFADDNRKSCPHCGTEYTYPEEKQSDVNIGLHAVEDIFRDNVDHVMLITGDSDQVPTFKLIERFKPSARRIAVFPPKRSGNELKQAATDSRSLSYIDIENSLFPNLVFAGDNYPVRRPDYYNPPEGWVAPKERP